MLTQITGDLVAAMDGLTFGPPVTHVYNPIVCARPAWDASGKEDVQGRRRVLMLGMNPGPPSLSNRREASTLRRCGRRNRYGQETTDAENSEGERDADRIP